MQKDYVNSVICQKREACEGYSSGQWLDLEGRRHLQMECFVKGKIGKVKCITHSVLSCASATQFLPCLSFLSWSLAFRIDKLKGSTLRGRKDHLEQMLELKTVPPRQLSM